MTLPEKMLVALTYLQASADGDTDTMLAVKDTVTDVELVEGLTEVSLQLAEMFAKTFDGKYPADVFPVDRVLKIMRDGLIGQNTDS